jgi:hypothetical protein
MCSKNQLRENKTNLPPFHLPSHFSHPACLPLSPSFLIHSTKTNPLSPLMYSTRITKITLRATNHCYIQITRGLCVCLCDKTFLSLSRDDKEVDNAVMTRCHPYHLASSSSVSSVAAGSSAYSFQKKQSCQRRGVTLPR